MSRRQDVLDFLAAYLVPMRVWTWWYRWRHPLPQLPPPPGKGEQVLYHGEGPYEVVDADGDDLTLLKPNGERMVASFSNCCDRVDV